LKGFNLQRVSLATLSMFEAPRGRDSLTEPPAWILFSFLCIPDDWQLSDAPRVFSTKHHFPFLSARAIKMCKKRVYRADIRIPVRLSHGHGQKDDELNVLL